MRGCIVAGSKINSKDVIKKAKSFAGLEGMDLAKEVSTKNIYSWSDGTWSLKKDVKKNNKTKWRVIAYDFGIKRNILRILVDLGCDVTVVPAKSSAEDVLAQKPNGIFLSNGPGDPAATGKYAIGIIKKLIKEEIPIFGICLGHQILALALGAKTKKMFQLLV